MSTVLQLNCGVLGSDLEMIFQATFDSKSTVCKVLDLKIQVLSMAIKTSNTWHVSILFDGRKALASINLNRLEPDTLRFQPN